jgi:hypothetical protein
MKKNEKITFQRLKLQKKFKIQRKPFSVQFLKKVQIFKLAHLQRKVQGKT